MVTDRTVQHKVLLPINYIINDSKILERKKEKNFNEKKKDSFTCKINKNELV